MKLVLAGIRNCLEGAIPGVVATCDADGTPNVSYVSQIHFVDANQVALSFQFFNKTRQNMLQNPQLTAYVIDPETTARYRLALLYLRTETEGPLFQNMKAKLAGIASHTGMKEVFQLRGADICQVLDIEPVPGPRSLPQPSNYNWLSILRSLGEALVCQPDLDNLFREFLQGLEDRLNISHAMILIADHNRRTLYTVASAGYTHSGIGSEIPFGYGIIGVAAEYHNPIRITHMAAEYSYGKAMRDNFADCEQLETAIPFPGLIEPHSQLAVPILAGQQLLGVLYVESELDLRFRYDDEDGLMILARQLASCIVQLQQETEMESVSLPGTSNLAKGEPAPHSGNSKTACLNVRYYHNNSSVFLDDHYLIKGVAGAILWRLLQQYQTEQRIDFSNRELRLDRQLNLPEFDDNLEARLILLQRRLTEKSDALAIIKTGRGRFRLQVTREIQLQEQYPELPA